MSEQYTSQPGDTLRKIASKKLGSPFRWVEILEANSWLTDPERQKRQADVGLPDREALFFTGEVFTIPGRDTLIDSGFPGDNPESYRIVLRGPGVTHEIQSALDVSEIRFMNNMADGFSFQIPFDNPHPDLVYLLQEDGYYDAFLYIGGRLEYQCVIYDQTRETTDRGLTCRVRCYSPTADAIDSRVEPPYVYNNVTLENLIIDNLTRPHAIDVTMEISDDTRFDQAQGDATETIASFLQKYANQRQAFISSRPDGGVRVWRAAINSQSVGTVEEGKKLPVGFLYQYSGRKRFTSYKGITESPSGNLTAFVNDKRVPLTRKTAIMIDSATTSAELRKAVTWHRNKVDAEAKKRVFPVTGLYAPNGELWKENTIVTIVSPTMNVPNGFDFLIEGLERKWGSNGIITDLHIADPVAFSTGEFS